MSITKYDFNINFLIQNEMYQPKNSYTIADVKRALYED